MFPKRVLNMKKGFSDHPLRVDESVWPIHLRPNLKKKKQLGDGGGGRYCFAEAEKEAQG
jgi:hypothetical protein